MKFPFTLKHCIFLILAFPTMTMAQSRIDVIDRDAIRELQTQIKRLETQIENAKSSGAIQLNTDNFKTSALQVLQQGKVTSAPSLGQEAVTKYLGSGEYCRGSGQSYANCIAIRNTKAAMLSDLESMLKQTDVRVQYVNQLLQRTRQGGLTGGQLQTLLAQISAYQTLIQTDAIRMNTTLEIYKQRLSLYQQQQRDYTNRMLYGGGGTTGSSGGSALPLNFF